MPLSDAARQAGGTEDKARGFDDFHAELEKKLNALTSIAEKLAEMKEDKNLTGKAAAAAAHQLHAQLTSAQQDITSALAQLVQIHKSDVTKPDQGSLQNAAKQMANADEQNWHALTRMVNRGIDANAAEIIASLQMLKIEYAFLPDRMKEKPDPYMPAYGLRPTMEQALTHAVHEAVRADNRDVLAALWQKLKFTKPEEYPPFLMELYQGAGYYQKPGSPEKLHPRPSVFGLITTKDYLGCLSVDQLNALLMTMAGHTSEVHKELAQFLEALPENRKQSLDYAAALRAAACNETRTETGSRKNVEILLPLVSQDIKDEVYKTIACMQPRLAHAGMKESQAAIDMADLLLTVAKKPLAGDTVADIAKTGSATNLRRALENAAEKDLPDILAAIVKPPSATSEDNILSVLKKAASAAVPPENTLLAVLDHAVLKGQLNLLKALVDIPQILPLLNAQETKPGHVNEDGNRILYKAAIYVGPGALRSPREKKEDVEKALAMLKILHNEGRGAEIPVIHGARGRGVLNTISQRIAEDAPNLENDDYLTLLKSRLQAKLAGDRARSEEAARLEVQQAHGLLGDGRSPVETRRLMLAQLTEEADAMDLKGTERTEHIKAGLASITPQQPAKLALGSGTASPPASAPAESPPAVKRGEPPEVIEAEIVPPPPQRKP